MAATNSFVIDRNAHSRIPKKRNNRTNIHNINVDVSELARERHGVCILNRPLEVLNENLPERSLSAEIPLRPRSAIPLSSVHLGIQV